MLQILPDLLRNLYTHGFLRLISRAADVGRENNVLHRGQR